MNDSNFILGPSSSPETNELTAALAQAQSEYPVVAFDSANPHFKSKFASYSQCCDALRKPLNKNGLALPDFRPGWINGAWVVVGTLRHTSGQWISGMAPLVNPKGDMQGFGAAMTYAKRTLLMSLTGGFSGEADDDGNSVSEPAKTVADKGAKHLVYQQEALNAIARAENAAAAQKALDLVELRVREKAVPAEVFRRCAAEYAKKWKPKEVKA